MDPLCDPVLNELGIAHGFGRRGSQVPERTVFPTQVHGIGVAEVGAGTRTALPSPPTADALFSRTAGSCIGIVTADCVPILLAAGDGSVVAAIHAGWRGLAAGIIEKTLRRLDSDSGDLGWVAAVGPAARGCCYEVDEPVRSALRERHAGRLSGVFEPGRKGRYQFDLSGLATEILADSGIDRARIGIENRRCTICHPDQFESYRRDGPGAGRLRHFIRGPSSTSLQG